MADLQLAAQQNAVRGLAYNLHQPCSILAENQIDKLGSPKLVILPSAQALRESTWQALLAYVKSGGNLLVTGPVSRDEHWHPVDRLTPLNLKGFAEPLTFHEGNLSVETRPENAPRQIMNGRLTFDQSRQQNVEYLNFLDDSTFKDVSLGTGQLFWIAYPLELAENYLEVPLFYRAIVQAAGIKPDLDVHTSWGGALPNTSILIYELQLQDAILYILESEVDRDIDLGLHHIPTEAVANIHLPKQHAALVLIDKHTKQIVAKYGF
jgi:hypothetical protein